MIQKYFGVSWIPVVVLASLPASPAFHLDLNDNNAFEESRKILYINRSQFHNAHVFRFNGKCNAASSFEACIIWDALCYTDRLEYISADRQTLLYTVYIKRISPLSIFIVFAPNFRTFHTYKKNSRQWNGNQFVVFRYSVQ